jgi:hypothetical protein
MQGATGLGARVLEETIGQDRTVDAVIEIENNRHKYQFAAEVKTVDRFETPRAVKARFKNRHPRPLLVAPYITREIGERCRNLHLPFIDTAGNTYLEAPGFFIYVIGNERPAALKQNRFRALNPAGLQITFALLCRPELIQTNHREIAAAAKVALGTVGPVMKDLEERGFLRFKARKQRKLLDPERILEEWVTHYPTTLRAKLHPRKFQADPDRFPKADLKVQNAYWGGEIAADRITNILRPAFFTIYARGPITKLVAANHLRADQNGNVEILEVFWNFEADPDYPDLVPPVLTYADLLATNDGRNAETAKLIYEQRIKPTLDRNN